MKFNALFDARSPLPVTIFSSDWPTKYVFGRRTRMEGIPDGESDSETASSDFVSVGMSRVLRSDPKKRSVAASA